MNAGKRLGEVVMARLNLIVVNIYILKINVEKLNLHVHLFSDFMNETHGLMLQYDAHCSFNWRDMYIKPPSFTCTCHMLRCTCT